MPTPEFKFSITVEATLAEVANLRGIVEVAMEEAGEDIAGAAMALARRIWNAAHTACHEHPDECQGQLDYDIARIAKGDAP